MASSRPLVQEAYPPQWPLSFQRAQSERYEKGHHLHLPPSLVCLASVASLEQAGVSCAAARLSLSELVLIRPRYQTLALMWSRRRANSVSDGHSLSPGVSVSSQRFLGHLGFSFSASPIAALEARQVFLLGVSRSPENPCDWE
jgi:hypothetical protein